MISQHGLHYELEGKAGAPVVVLAHALGLASCMWDRQRAALARDYRVLRYDARGHGASALTASSEPPSIAQLAGDVLSLLDELDIDHASFCGLSTGGVVGLWLGVHAPARVRSLVVVSATPRMGTPEGWQARIDSVPGAGLAAIAAAVAPRSFTPRFRRDEPAVVKRFIDVMAGGSPAAFVSGCAAMRGADLRADLEDLMVPTLFVAGSADPVTTAADIRRAAARVPVATFVELPASHIVNVEAAAAFNAVLLRFLGEHASPPPPPRSIARIGDGVAAHSPVRARHLRVAR